MRLIKRYTVTGGLCNVVMIDLLKSRVFPLYLPTLLHLFVCLMKAEYALFLGHVSERLVRIDQKLVCCFHCGYAVISRLHLKCRSMLLLSVQIADSVSDIAPGGAANKTGPVKNS